MPGLTKLEWPRTAGRLSIRRALPTDGPTVWEWRCHPSVSNWLNSMPADREPYLRRWTTGCRRWLAAELDGALVAIGKVDPEQAWAQDEVVIRAAGTQAEIGWLVNPDFQGRGHGTEFAAALLEIAFDADYRRVTAYCFADNEASWRIMERIGMRREAHFVADSLHRSGEWLDSYAYGLLADEYRDRLA